MSVAGFSGILMNSWYGSPSPQHTGTKVYVFKIHSLQSSTLNEEGF